MAIRRGDGQHAKINEGASPLGSLAERAQIGRCGVVLQRRPVYYRQIYIPAPTLIVVDRGRKTVRAADGYRCCIAGETVCIAGGQMIEVRNEPDCNEYYWERWLSWDPRLISAYVVRNGPIRALDGVTSLSGPSDRFRHAVTLAYSALSKDKMSFSSAEKRMGDLLAALGAQGIRFRRELDNSILVRLGTLVTQDPKREWHTSEGLGALDACPAMLHRQLKLEGMTYKAFVRAVRLSAALKLLQANGGSLKEIASSTGFFRGAGQLSCAFRDHFGFSPSSVRALATCDFDRDPDVPFSGLAAQGLDVGTSSAADAVGRPRTNASVDESPPDKTALMLLEWDALQTQVSASAWRVDALEQRLMKSVRRPSSAEIEHAQQAKAQVSARVRAWIERQRQLEISN